jgi:lysophospholipase L1-like esterase
VLIGFRLIIDPGRVIKTGRMALLASILAVTILAPLSPAQGPRVPRIHLAGDSTMADKPTDPPNPEHGWGQLLPEFFSDPTMIVNHAANGRSTRSFITEGRWQALVDALRAGDWVVIQFAHNDEKIFPDAGGEFQDNLRRFVADVRAKQANPILATPCARRSFDDTGRLVDTHGDYPDAVRTVAAEAGVPLLELNRLTSALEEGHGPEGSKRLHLWISPGAYQRQPDGYQDDTHYSAYGADRVALLAVQEIIRLDLSLADWLR